MGLEVLFHQVQKLRVKGNTLLQEEAVGEVDHMVSFLIGQWCCEVLKQRELSI